MPSNFFFLIKENINILFYLINSYCEYLAIGVLDIYDTNTEDEENIHILLDNIEFFQMTPLDMALIGDCKNFVSHPSVQNLLTKIWNGHSAQNYHSCKSFMAILFNKK